MIKIENIKNVSDEKLYEYFWEGGFKQNDLEYNDESRNIYIDAFFAIHMLEAEVYNGGFDQFFANGGYEIYSEDALFGLEKMGTSMFENLLREAIIIHLESTEEEKSLRNPKYDLLDDKFYDYNERGQIELSNLKILQLKFIRNNIELIKKG